MKKELFAALSILALIIGAVVNVLYLMDLADGISYHVEASQQYCRDDDFDQAEAELRIALEIWLKADGYTHIFIRHVEIDGTADAFYDTLSHVMDHDKDSAVGAYEKLMYHINSIVSMEKVTIKSVF